MALLIGVKDSLLFTVLCKIGGGDKVTGIEQVLFLSLLLHLVVVGGCKETTIGEQRLIDGTELVNAELGVGDSAPPLVASATAACRAGE